MYNYVPISFSLLLVSSSDLQSSIISNTTEVEKAMIFIVTDMERRTGQKYQSRFTSLNNQF